ncbi:MAG TPA: MaoC/PaaZ C-terminal domain-containing protein [Gaiellaceae bacterium]|nr:MaoC/PaaZ C-terminal domain-containing protein [Gaiellaceae bacterium]
MSAVADFRLESLGAQGPERRYVVTAEAIRAYAAATDDRAPAAAEGRVAPPVFAIVPVWETIAPASRSVVSEEARRRVVHYAQDLVLHRPLEAGMSVVSFAIPVALLEHPKGAQLAIKTETRLDDGALVNEQYVTEFFRDVSAGTSSGDRPPDHRLSDDLRGGEPLAELSYPVAADQTERYAAASGDDFEIHLDDAAARAVGLPGRIVHGLCTMALAGRAVLEAAGVEDPGAVRRLAVRFSAPLRPGGVVTTRVWRLAGRTTFGFEALDASGTTVLRDGRAELRA